MLRYKKEKLHKVQDNLVATTERTCGRGVTRKHCKQKGKHALEQRKPLMRQRWQTSWAAPAPWPSEQGVHACTGLWDAAHAGPWVSRAGPAAASAHLQSLPTCWQLPVLSPMGLTQQLLSGTSQLAVWPLNGSQLWLSFERCSNASALSCDEDEDRTDKKSYHVKWPRDRLSGHGVCLKRGDQLCISYNKEKTGLGLGHIGHMMMMTKFPPFC